MRVLRTAVRRAFLPLAGIVVATTLPAQAPAPGSANKAHPVEPTSVKAVARQGQITIDGRLDEGAWSAAQPATGFKQSEPNDGQPATQRTEVRFIFDDDALYIGARMFDSLGAAGVRGRLARRDVYSEDADWIDIFIDTFHDHLGKSEFALNASGTRYDANGPGGSNMDVSWDPVWESAAGVDSLGWVAEMRIPFSQLRYPREEIQTWGIQIIRYLPRLRERTHYAHWLRTETGGASRYNHIEDVRVGKSYKRLEVLPYLVGRNRYIRPSNPVDPFQHKVEYDYRAGADVKYLLTPNLTLNATINPDFGQVEADPAVINLSAFETSLSERRPFFIEGSGLLGFGGLSCYFCSNASGLSLFSSRRVGRTPQVTSAANSMRGDTGFVDVPDNTTILGAAKLTGRTKGGWSIGAMNALTREEKADIRLRRTAGGELDTFQIIEPQTNYFVGRVKKDLRGGNLTLGGIATALNRKMNDPKVFNAIPDNAQALGMDWRAFFRNRSYIFHGQAAYSQVHGSPSAMLSRQRSSAHYFQRPDRDNSRDGFFTDSLDPSSTFMRGYALYARGAKEGGKWLGELQTNVRSPGFDVNEMAFFRNGDFIWNAGNIVFNDQTPGKWYRQLWVNGGAQYQVNYDGDRTDAQTHFYIQPQLKNYWSMSLGYMRRPELEDDRLLRGGPVVNRPGSTNIFFNLDTDSRKKVVFGFYPNYGVSTEGVAGYGAALAVRYKPATNIEVRFHPFYGKNASANQYVTDYADSTSDLFYDRRYVLSSLEQHTLEFSTRLQWTFTPTLSFEGVLTPLLGAVNYHDFKQYERPRTLKRVLFGPGQIDSVVTDGRVETYTIDPDGAGTQAQTRTFNNPDFNFRSLLGNAVLRWEYLPGSTMFVVWQQSRNDGDSFGDFDFGRSNRRLWGRNPNNIFLVKVNYWLNF